MNWIPLTEDLPSINNDWVGQDDRSIEVLGTDGQDIRVCYLIFGENTWEISGQDENHRFFVTYWMPLPELA